MVNEYQQEFADLIMKPSKSSHFSLSRNLDALETISMSGLFSKLNI
jgi:hypothetical protein